MPAPNPRVFVPSRFDKHNATDAARYGQIIYLDDRPGYQNISPFHVAEFTAQAVELLEECGFNPQVDKLVVGGRILTTVLVTAAVSSRWQTISLLLFDAARDQYVEKVLKAQMPVER